MKTTTTSVFGVLALAAALAAQGFAQDRSTTWLHRASSESRGHTSLAQFQGQRRGPSDEDKERFRVRLGLTKQQQAAIEQLFEASGQRMHELREKYRELTNKLNDEVYFHYDFDRNQARQLRHEIIGLHVRMGRIHDDNEEALRKILTRDQFDKMKAMIREDMAKHRKEFEERRRSGAPPGPMPP